MTDHITTADYAASDARQAREDIAKLEKRLAILEGVCRVAIQVNPLEVEAAIKKIAQERDELEAADSVRIRKLNEDRETEQEKIRRILYRPTRLSL